MVSLLTRVGAAKAAPTYGVKGMLLNDLRYFERLVEL